MSGRTIRRANSGDIPYIMNIAQQSATAAHWPVEEYARIFDPGSAPRIAFVIETEKQIAGFVVLRSMEKEWELENVAVALPFRRQGLGRALLEAMLVLARKTGANRIFLEVRESNEAARHLYAQLGFRKTGCRPGYYSHPIEDAVTYEIVTEL